MKIDSGIIQKNRIGFEDDLSEETPREEREDQLIVSNDNEDDETKIIHKYEKWNIRMSNILIILFIFSINNIVFGVIPQGKILQKIFNQYFFHKSEDLSSSETDFIPISVQLWHIYYYMVNKDVNDYSKTDIQSNQASELLESYQVSIRQFLLPLGIISCAYSIYASRWLSIDGVLKYSMANQIFYQFVFLDIILCIEFLHYLFHLIWFWIEYQFLQQRFTYVIEVFIVVIAVLWFSMSFWVAKKFIKICKIQYKYRKYIKTSNSSQIELSNTKSFSQ